MTMKGTGEKKGKKGKIAMRDLDVGKIEGGLKNDGGPTGGTSVPPSSPGGHGVQGNPIGTDPIGRR